MTNNTKQENPLQDFIDLLENNTLTTLLSNFAYCAEDYPWEEYNTVTETKTYRHVNDENEIVTKYTESFHDFLEKTIKDQTSNLRKFFGEKINQFKTFKESNKYFDNLNITVQSLIEKAQEPQFCKYPFIVNYLHSLSAYMHLNAKKKHLIHTLNLPNNESFDHLFMEFFFNVTMKKLHTPALQSKYINEEIEKLEHQIYEQAHSQNNNLPSWFEEKHQELNWWRYKLNLFEESQKSLPVSITTQTHTLNTTSRNPANVVFFTQATVKTSLDVTNEFDIVFSKPCLDATTSNPLITGTSICQYCYSNALLKLLKRVPSIRHKEFIAYQLSHQVNKITWLGELNNFIISNEKHLNRNNPNTTNHYLVLIAELQNESIIGSVVSSTIAAAHVPLKEAEIITIPPPPVETFDSIVSSTNLNFILSMLETIGLTVNGNYALTQKKKGAVRGVVLALIVSGHIPNKGIDKCTKLLGVKIGVEIKSKLEDTNVSDDYKAKAEKYINSQSS